MKICCLGLVLLIIVLIKIYQIYESNKYCKEGFPVPSRQIDADLQSYLKLGLSGGLTLTDKSRLKSESAVTDTKRRYDPKNNFGAEIARANRSDCSESGNYHGCAVSSPSPPKIDIRYLSLPTTELDASNAYNHLSICPRTYQTNMDILHKKQSIGQYSGYTPNEYIDKIRYVKPTLPLPVNPDFFAKGGGTY